MKLAALAVAVIMTACEKPVINDSDATDEHGNPVEQVDADTKKFTFTLKGDFSDNWKPVTRGYLAADGKDLTDVWVLDYDADGHLLQQLHQNDNTADDFGKPVMNLKYGMHHIYFVASRGTNAELDMTNKTITWEKVSDTFYKHYEVSVVNTSNGNRAVTLDRVVTRLRLTFTDVVSSDAAVIAITPSTWYYGINYLTGEPAADKTSETRCINIPAKEVGYAGMQVNLYGFSTADEWQTDVTVQSQKANNEVIGGTVLTDVPFKVNRITEFSGPIFSTDGALGLSLNTTWDSSYEGTW